MADGVRYVNGQTDIITVGATAAVAHTFTATQLTYQSFLIGPTEATAHVLYIRERLAGDAAAAAVTDGVIPSSQGAIWERGSAITTISIYNPGASAVDVFICPLVSAG